VSDPPHVMMMTTGPSPHNLQYPSHSFNRLEIGSIENTGSFVHQNVHKMDKLVLPSVNKANTIVSKTSASIMQSYNLLENQMSQPLSS
jgi:hypothetical protein